MKSANAFIMITLGAAMVAAPQLVPDWFPRTGIDGSSTRALWMSVVGGAQAVLAVLWLGREVLAQQWARLQAALPVSRPKPEFGWDEREDLVYGAALAPATVVEPAGSITLNGEYAELWRAFQTALVSRGPAAQLAEQAVALARHEGWSAAATGTAGDADQVLTFTWTQDEAATVRQQNETSVAA